MPSRLLYDDLDGMIVSGPSGLADEMTSTTLYADIALFSCVYSWDGKI